MIFSIGNCPVCGDFSRVIFARDRRTRRLFVFCGACGVAWLNPADAARLDSVLSCNDVAPDGIELPTKSDIVEAGLDQFTDTEYGDEEWWIDLGEFFKK
jgi:hypothetical protein